MVSNERFSSISTTKCSIRASEDFPSGDAALRLPNENSLQKSRSDIMTAPFRLLLRPGGSQLAVSQLVPGLRRLLAFPRHRLGGRCRDGRADHAVARDELGELFFAPVLRPPGTHG